MPIAAGNADLVRVGPGVLNLAPYGTPLPAPGSAPDAPLDAAFRQVGFTTGGSDLTYNQTSAGVAVAERLRPIKTIITGVDMTFAFAMAEISPHNLAIATNAPAANVTTTADSVTFVWPKAGGTNRWSIVWQADDDLERMVLAKCFAGGSITIPRHRGTDPAALSVTFTVEENSDATLGGGADAWYLVDPALVA